MQHVYLRCIICKFRNVRFIFNCGCEEFKQIIILDFMDKSWCMILLIEFVFLSIKFWEWDYWRKKQESFLLGPQWLLADQIQHKWKGACPASLCCYESHAGPSVLGHMASPCHAPWLQPRCGGFPENYPKQSQWKKKESHFPAWVAAQGVSMDIRTECLVPM